MRPIVTHLAHSVVCMLVCLCAVCWAHRLALHNGWTSRDAGCGAYSCGPKEPCISGGGAHCRHPGNTIERSGARDAALCRIILTTCYYSSTKKVLHSSYLVSFFTSARQRSYVVSKLYHKTRKKWWLNSSMSGLSGLQSLSPIKTDSRCVVIW